MRYVFLALYFLSLATLLWDALDLTNNPNAGYNNVLSMKAFMNDIVLMSRLSDPNHY